VLCAWNVGLPDEILSCFIKRGPLLEFQVLVWIENRAFLMELSALCMECRALV